MELPIVFQEIADGSMIKISLLKSRVGDGINIYYKREVSHSQFIIRAILAGLVVQLESFPTQFAFHSSFDQLLADLEPTASSMGNPLSIYTSDNFRKDSKKLMIQMLSFPTQFALHSSFDQLWPSKNSLRP